jgi:hypothetical protein
MAEAIELDAIDPNPRRNMTDTPLDKEIIESHIAYYKAHGSFPGTPVARRAGNHVQLAYGHHILEAAKQLGLDQLQVEVRELDDEQMLALMPTHSGPHAKLEMLLRGIPRKMSMRANPRNWRASLAGCGMTPGAPGS